MTIFCSNCGTQSVESDVFCRNCGKPLNRATADYTSAAGQAAPPPTIILQEPAPHTSGFSIAALVLGLLSIWPLAIIFGGIGISQTKPGRNVSGRGMAIAGLALGIVVGLLWIGLFTWAFIIGFTHTNLPIIGGSSV
jgi:uncharacterized membrane protein YvbJ